MQHLTFININSKYFDRAVENVQRKIIKQKNTLSQRMQYTYPVLSRIGPWMRDKQTIAEVVKLLLNIIIYNKFKYMFLCLY